MLSETIRPINFGEINKEEWDIYSKRLSLPENEALRQFYRQIVYDHFDHHNEHYPDFEIDDYEYVIKKLTIKEVNEKVKFFNNERMDCWGKQYDEFEKKNDPYIIYQEMGKNHTPPFPPIIIDSSNLIDNGWRVYGRPIHLIEGTHRVSYLLHMARRGIIEWESQHEFVLLTKKL